MKKLGQAALEFLSTYGFAFLIILVMIGALSYFGVLSPGRFLPDRCLVNQELTCEEYQLTRTSDTNANVTIVLSNNLGNAIRVNASSFDFDSTFVSGGGAADCGTNEMLLSQGEDIIVSCDLAGELPSAGEKARMQFTGVFRELGRTLDRPINGELFVTIQSP